MPSRGLGRPPAAQALDRNWTGSDRVFGERDASRTFTSLALVLLMKVPVRSAHSPWYSSVIDQLGGGVFASAGGGIGSSRSRETSRRHWLTEPRTAVLAVLGVVVLVGGGRRLVQGFRARRAIARLSEPEVTPDDVAAASQFGRAGLHELFRLLCEAPDTRIRCAAGEALASLWAEDQLIAEEEQALVLRGYTVDWISRRKYPRDLRLEIPIELRYGLFFLSDDGRGIRPANLEWSHRIVGAKRASLEEDSPWKSGPRRLRFTIVPEDFQSQGPHRIVLQTRVRTAGLTAAWELALPHVALTFEFDPKLSLDSLLGLPDAVRGEQIKQSVELVTLPADEGGSRFLPFGDHLAIRNPPRIRIRSPLPCDLAHDVKLEIEGVSELIPAGSLVLKGESGRSDVSSGGAAVAEHFEIGPLSPRVGAIVERPGFRRLRLVLRANAELGWTDPAIRSIWPGTITTDWAEFEVVRR